MSSVIAKATTPKQAEGTRIRITNSYATETIILVTIKTVDDAIIVSEDVNIPQNSSKDYSISPGGYRVSIHTFSSGGSTYTYSTSSFTVLDGEIKIVVYNGYGLYVH
jgi:hypothetical protein